MIGIQTDRETGRLADTQSISFSREARMNGWWWPGWQKDGRTDRQNYRNLSLLQMLKDEVLFLLLLLSSTTVKPRNCMSSYMICCWQHSFSFVVFFAVIVLNCWLKEKWWTWNVVDDWELYEMLLMKIIVTLRNDKRYDQCFIITFPTMQTNLQHSWYVYMSEHFD